jgi:peptidoglycan/LPS O-acetylase OafA/YrhL
MQGLAAKRSAVAQIPSLTPLRGLAALFVVAFHLQFFIPNLHYEATVPAFLLGYVWVDFFFVLSGFIIAHVYGRGLEDGIRGFQYGAFLYARWTRVYPLHFAVVLAFVAFEFVQIGLHHGLGLLPGLDAFAGHHAVSGIFSQLFLVNSIGLHDSLLWNYASWSISAEFFAYLAFPVLFVALNRRSAAVSWLAFSILLGLLNLLALSNGGRLALHHDYGAVRCLLEFSIGILTYQAYRSEHLRRWIASDAAFLTALGLIFIGMMTYVRDILLIPAFVTLILSAARNEGTVARVLATRTLTHLGNISYSIYMVNILLFEIVNTVSKLMTGAQFGKDFGIGESWLAWFAAMALVIAVSTWTHRHIERFAEIYLRRLRWNRGPAEEQETALVAGQPVGASGA